MNIKKIAKVVALAILAVVLLLLAVITVAVNYLRPEKLTPIVERYANEYLNRPYRYKFLEHLPAI